jgi:hypothetical protein
MRKRSRSFLPVAALMAAGVLAACDAPTASENARAGQEPSFLITPACAGTGGQTHASTTIGNVQTWTLANSPHRVTGTITVGYAGRLTIAPGAVVCFDPGTGITAQNGGRVLARGRDTAVIVLTARDPAVGWSGIQFYGSPAVSSYLTNVRIEHVAYSNVAVGAYEYHPVVLDSAVIRRSGQAVHLHSPASRFSRSRVDTTTNRGVPAVDLANGATFEKSTVRRSAGIGVRVSGPNVSLIGGRIEGSGGVGLHMWSYYQTGATMQTVRVVNGRSYGVDLPAEAMMRLYPTPGQQDSARGNARDTLLLSGGYLKKPLTFGPRIPVRVTSTITVDSIGVLFAQPGAQLVFDPSAGIYAQGGGRVEARGTAAKPVLFLADDPAVGWAGITLTSPATRTSYLTNVRIEDVGYYHTAVTAYDYHRVTVDSAVIRNSGAAAALYSNNSRISRTRVDSTLYSGVPAVTLAASAKIESTLIRAAAGTGLLLTSPLALVGSCEIREGDGVGIEMYSPVAVHGCNLVDNVGVGISNLSGSNADVKNNWWGSAGGPAGAGGDGMSGALVFSPWSTVPFVLPYVP